MTLRKEAPHFKCRSSALGQLMTPAKSKSQTLSETAKSMLTLWYKEQLYGRKKEISSKYMTKGNLMEDSSIAYINKLYGTDYTKNDTWYENEHLHGTPDIIGDDIIIDIKNSWDFSTFPLFSSYLPTKDYLWQVQAYMMLTGKRKGAVVYTLMDLPDEQIEWEWRRSGSFGPVTEEFARNYKYNDLHDDLRVKRYDLEYSDEMATEIADKVEAAREFIKMLRY